METNVAFLCTDISRLFQKRFADAAREIGGTGAQWRALLVLQRSPGINQGVLAEHLDVEPITACRMVDRLEQAGLVRRQRDPDDRRVWQLFITEDAAPVVDELRTVGKRMLEQAMAALNADERDKLHAYLEKVRDSIAAMDQEFMDAEAQNG